jgi:two-component system, NarL family, nitrate/nitrite response regulator NarL
MRNPIRIGLVTGHPMFCEGLTHAIGASANLSVVAQGENAADAFRIAEDASLDILLLEIEIPGVGVDALGSIFRAKCKARVIVLTALDDEALLIDALRAGARGYLLKDITGADLIYAIECVHRGQPQITPALAARALSSLATRHATLPDRKLGQLTARELQVLTYLSQGLTNREIGLKLGINVKTVKHHTVLLFAKLGVRNRVEAASTLRNGASSMVPMEVGLPH